MNRIEKTFQELRSKNKKAFIPYIMAGDPSLEKTKELVHILAEHGADIIELGVPFTDPVADGPTIQRAAERALKNKVTLRKVISLVKELRMKTRIPLVLMTYYNPVFKYGEEQFMKDSMTAGVDGVIIPDLPPDEADDLIRFAQASGIATIFLLAPTSTHDRIKKVASSSKGFIYYVSMTGTTGASLSVDAAIEKAIVRIKKITSMPVAVGFGISTPEEAAQMSAVSDGVIVGSAIVKKIAQTQESDSLYRNLTAFLDTMRNAIR